MRNHHAARTLIAGFTSCLVLTAIAACGGSDGSGQQTAPASTGVGSETSRAQAPVDKTVPTPAPSGAAIRIENFRFTDLTVPPGAQITVVNDDSAEHSVTSDTAGAFDVEVGGKQTVTFTAPNAPGTYAFHCTYHPNMHGVLTVT